MDRLLNDVTANFRVLLKDIVESLFGNFCHLAIRLCLNCKERVAVEDALNFTDKRSLLQKTKADACPAIIVLKDFVLTLASDKDVPILMIELTDDFLLGLEELEANLLDQAIDNLILVFLLAEQWIVIENIPVEKDLNLLLKTRIQMIQECLQCILGIEGWRLLKKLMPYTLLHIKWQL